ncbi:reverse transcriptase [Plakobranchus ocellatus]|uniref:Reverse transcriptase n=1 Tax=Plakobranchus ocellatus TaxID=259542 RepID=A0AAV4BA14_9GAST|nr:reverse transcriptase [Plakobranchus ocellatus]
MGMNNPADRESVGNMLVGKGLLDELVGKSILEHKLETLGVIVCQICLATFGAKQHKVRVPPRKSRRQCDMETLRNQKRNLKKQMKSAPVDEQAGLQARWLGLKAKHSALSRAESARKRRKTRERKHKRFSAKTRSISPASCFNNQDQVP